MNSLMYEWELLKRIIDEWEFQITVSLGAFGAVSSKPLDVRGSWEGLPIVRAIYVEVMRLVGLDRFSEKLTLTKQSGRRKCVQLKFCFDVGSSLHNGLSLYYLFKVLNPTVVS